MKIGHLNSHCHPLCAITNTLLPLTSPHLKRLEMDMDVSNWVGGAGHVRSPCISKALGGIYDYIGTLIQDMSNGSH
jgi:hypothetical protein